MSDIVTVDQIHQGDVGIVFQEEILKEDGTPFDLSAATVLQFIFQRPDRTSFVTNAYFVTDGRDGQIKYATLPGDLSQLGLWSYQFHFKIGALEKYLDPDYFTVFANLPTWYSEFVIIFRHMIDDLDEPKKYADNRIAQLLLVAAQLAQSENFFSQDYTINVSNLTLSPDPTASGTRDDAFINLTLLKAACTLARGGLLKAAKGGLLVKEGDYSFDNRSKFAGQKIASEDWCKAYSDAQYEYAVYHTEPGRVIIGPHRTFFVREGYRYQRPLYSGGLF
jgi:hypothetical protein